MRRPSSNGCSVVRCNQGAKFSNVAMCQKHFSPHLKVMEERGVQPFHAPASGEATEKYFNHHRWFWFRGRWRIGAIQGGDPC